MRNNITCTIRFNKMQCEKIQNNFQCYVVFDGPESRILRQSYRRQWD
jgi:hypothetical protein